MYCPHCLNNTLVMSSRGIVNITINGKTMSNARFLYNFSQESKQEVQDNFVIKLNEILKWCSTLTNLGPIHQIDLISNSFACSSGCVIGAKEQFSVLDILLPKEYIFKILQELAPRYNLEVRLRPAL